MPRDDTTPSVSVLLAVHNGARYVEQAIRSVMAQTLRDIEILVVDDASSDASPDILARLAAEDDRIRVLRLETNLRLAGALNHGLDHARAPYVARMDDDDWAHPNRLEVQKRFLDTHPEIDLAGASTRRMDKDGHVFRSRVRALDSFAIRWQARFLLNVSHPTFMFRTHMPDGQPVRYDAAFPLSQDHEMICRLLLAGGQVVCLPDILLDFRFHERSVSQSRFKEQVAISKRICRNFQERELPDDIVAGLDPLRQLYFTAARATPELTAAAFAGARAMLDHDISRAPDRAAWLRRQTAQLLEWALGRGGLSRRAVLASFLRHEPGLLPALGLRALETKGALPWLSTTPEVWRTAASPSPRSPATGSVRAKDGETR